MKKIAPRWPSFNTMYLYLRIGAYIFEPPCR